MARPTDHARKFSTCEVRVGSGRVGSGRVGSGRVGSGRVGSGRVGSGRVGSGQEGFIYYWSGRVTLTRPGPGEAIRPVIESPENKTHLKQAQREKDGGADEAEGVGASGEHCRGSECLKHVREHIPWTKTFGKKQNNKHGKSARMVVSECTHTNIG